MLLRQQIKISGIVCVVLVALVLWALSFGAFNGTPRRHLKRYGDIHALVPWLFHQIAAALQGRPVPPDPSLAQQRACLLQHYDLIVDRFGAEKGTTLMRKYACCYAQGRRGSRHFRAHVATVRSPSEFHQVVAEFFPAA